MTPALRDLVRERAGNRCEYCGIHQEAESFATFHIEHIVARQHGGADNEANLALSCHHCNRHKGPNLTGVDPLTSQVVLLFHPRKQKWHEHFARQGARIVGLSAAGRATMRLLRMNTPERIERRANS